MWKKQLLQIETLIHTYKFVLYYRGFEEISTYPLNTDWEHLPTIENKLYHNSFL